VAAAVVGNEGFDRTAVQELEIGNVRGAKSIASDAVELRVQPCIELTAEESDLRLVDGAQRQDLELGHFNTCFVTPRWNSSECAIEARSK
jgi:hypothetical protein